MGLEEIALAGLGLVLVGSYAEKTGAGKGLESLGVGVQTILAAPGTGFGLGLGETAGGIRAIGEAFGDIGRGIGEIFRFLPTAPIVPYLPPGDPGNLVPDSGGSGSDLLPGGGGNVPGPSYTALPEFKPDSPTFGLGRIYQVNGGVFGFRKAPGLEFSTRAEARTYLKAYGNDAMEGTYV